MYTYKLTFTVNGIRTSAIVSANSLSAAQRIIREQYAGARIVFISTGHERQ